MRILWRFAVPLALVPAFTLAGWQQHTHSQTGKITAEPAWSELAASMDKMHASMASVQPSGDGDVDFVKLMLPHHRAAIEMAKTQLLYGRDPQMRRLAQEIMTDQQAEVELMQLWLKQRDAASSKPDAR